MIEALLLGGPHDGRIIKSADHKTHQIRLPEEMPFETATGIITYTRAYSGVFVFEPDNWQLISLNALVSAKLPSDVLSKYMDELKGKLLTRRPDLDLRSIRPTTELSPEFEGLVKIRYKALAFMGEDACNDWTLDTGKECPADLLECINPDIDHTGNHSDGQTEWNRIGVVVNSEESA